MLFGSKKKKNEDGQRPIMPTRVKVIEKKEHFLQVQRTISSYSGYKGSRRKEDDLAIRRRVLEEIDKSREVLTDILEDAYNDGDTKTQQEVRKAQDQLDVFSDEVDLAESGHKYSFFSAQRSISGGMIKQLTKFDASIIDLMNQLVKAAARVQTKYLGKDSSLSTVKELRKIKQYITTARNEFTNRIEYIKKI
ncbi:MAG: hypothetical protein QGH39_12175 [Candidatus Thermoplasmatota archaeon]|nr:hypothetical protein [Candidatus Thermoplasmatota archaeon]MDP7266302.1 hypothetical protein [Candidatus Thermoplasmatota archaeon]